MNLIVPRTQHKTSWVLFENRPALYFCNYIFITAYSVSKIRFKFFIANNYDSINEIIDS